VNLDTIVTIRKKSLKEKITMLDTEKIKQVNDAIKFSLDIS